MKNKQAFVFDRSSYLLVFSNIVTIIIAIWEKWNLSDVMWIYWGQSLVIGFFNWRRIRCLRQFSIDGLRINDQPAPPTRATQRYLAFFFALHYGGFHALYLAFLFTERSASARLDPIAAIVCIAIFAINHHFSFRYNLERDINRKPNIGTVMLFPYARILPMHILILVGTIFIKCEVGMLILFLSVKTVADLLMHIIEHNESRISTFLSSSG